MRVRLTFNNGDVFILNNVAELQSNRGTVHYKQRADSGCWWYLRTVYGVRDILVN